MQQGWLLSSAMDLLLCQNCGRSFRLGPTNGRDSVRCPQCSAFVKTSAPSSCAGPSRSLVSSACSSRSMTSLPQVPPEPDPQPDKVSLSEDVFDLNLSRTKSQDKTDILPAISIEATPERERHFRPYSSGIRRIPTSVPLTTAKQRTSRLRGTAKAAGILLGLMGAAVVFLSILRWF